MTSIIQKKLGKQILTAGGAGKYPYNLINKGEDL